MAIDLFTLEEEEQEEVEDQSSGPMKSLRNHAKKLERQLKALTTENEELKAFKSAAETETLKNTTASIFKELGLTDKQAELYTKVNPDVLATPELAKAFATEYGWQLPEVEESEEEGESAPFAPLPTSGAPAPTGQIMDSDKWFDLYKTNPAEAIRIANKGRVSLLTEDK